MNTKFIVDKFKSDKEKPYNIIKVKVAPNRKCKICDDKPRRNGSAYCQDCANINKT